MNILSKALDHIKHTIPPQVLKAAFRDELMNWRQAPVSLDTQIMDKVIKPRVLFDANLVGGTQAIIALDGLAAVYGDNYSNVYQIPFERTSNREIVSVLSVGYLPIGGSFGYGAIGVPAHVSDVMTAGQRVMDSNSSIPVVSTAQCDLIGFNTVLIRDPQRTTMTYTLRCMLANESNLNNINPRSYLYFATLCQLAVKSFIYNNMLITMDQAYLQGGQELGALKNYVETLQDSEEQYQVFLRETWQGVAFMNDRTSHERFIRTQISPGL